jgi:hypothetical protein
MAGPLLRRPGLKPRQLNFDVSRGKTYGLPHHHFVTGQFHLSDFAGWGSLWHASGPQPGDSGRADMLV